MRQGSQAVQLQLQREGSSRVSRASRRATSARTRRRQTEHTFFPPLAVHFSRFRALLHG